MATKQSPRRRAPKQAAPRPKKQLVRLVAAEERQPNGYVWRGWWLRWTDKAGKYQRRRFGGEDEARLEKARLEVELMNAETAFRHRQTRLTDAQLAECEAAVDRLGDRGTIAEAVAHFLATAARPDKAVCWRDGRSAFLDSKEREGLRPRSLVQLKSTIDQFGRWAGNPQLHEVSGADVEKFLRTLRGRDGGPAAPKTWNGARGDLSSFLGWCSDPARRWTPRNAAAEVPKRRAHGRDVPEILTAEEALRVMRLAARAYGGRLVPYFALALFAGARPAEIAGLADDRGRPAAIDLDRGVIRVRPAVSKTGQYREIEIRPNLARWLRQFEGLPIRPANFDRMVKRLRRHLARRGLALGHDVLRHTFISAHVAAFQSVGGASLEAGNSEAIVRRHYLNLGARADAGRFWAISPTAAGAGFDGAAAAEPTKIVTLAAAAG